MAEAKDHMVFHRSLTDLSNEIAGVIEHLVIPEIVTACWDRGLDVDVLHADIDSGGYELGSRGGSDDWKGDLPHPPYPVQGLIQEGQTPRGAHEYRAAPGRVHRLDHLDSPTGRFDQGSSHPLLRC